MNACLILDVGNTSFKYGIFKNGKLITFYASFNIKNFISRINNLLDDSLSQMPIIIGSTNDLFRDKILTNLNVSEKKWKKQISFLQKKKDNQFGLSNKVFKELGLDLYAFINFFYDKTPCVIINFGTAISIIKINEEQNIDITLIPGLNLAENALRNKAEKIATTRETTETNKAIKKGRELLITSILYWLVEHNENKASQLSIHISGGDYKEVQLVLEKHSYISTTVQRNNDMMIYQINKTKIILYQQLSLLCYYQLWVEQVKQHYN